MSDEVSEVEALDVPADVDEGRKVRRKRGHVEVLPSGTVRLRLRGQWPDGTGIDESYSFAQGTLAERKAAARAALPGLWREIEEKESGQVRRVLALTLAEAVEKLRKEGLHKVRKGDFSSHPVRVWKGYDLREFTDARWEAWVERMRGEGYAAATIRHAYSAVSAVVMRCVAEGWIAERPWRDVSRWLPPEKDTRTRRALDPHETESLIAAAERMDKEGRSHGLALRVRVQYHCFCRPLELVRMGPLNLVEVGAVPHLRWQAVKGGPIREFPLSERLADELREHWAALPALAKKAGVFFPIRGPRGKWSARVKKVGAYETGVLWTDAETKVLRELSGIADVSPYHMRHTGVTDTTIDAVLSAPEIQFIGGWQTQRMVARYMRARMDAGKIALLSKEKGASRREATPTPTRAMVVHTTERSEREKAPVKTGGTTGPRDDVQRKDGKKRVDHPHGLAVDAALVERGLVALGALRQQVRDAGSVMAWLRVTTIAPEDLLDAAADLEAVAAVTTLPEPGDRGLVQQFCSAVRAHARRPKILAPISGSENAQKVKDNGHLRLVAGVSFTSSVGGSSEDE